MLDEAHDAWIRSLPLERREEADLLYNAHFNTRSRTCLLNGSSHRSPVLWPKSRPRIMKVS